MAAVHQDIEAEHVNEYLREATDGDVTAKDFRTWAGTMDAAGYLRKFGPAKTKREAERNVVRAIDHTAKRLGNTRTVCRKYYIHPALLKARASGPFRWRETSSATSTIATTIATASRPRKPH